MKPKTTAVYKIKKYKKYKNKVHRNARPSRGYSNLGRVWVSCVCL